MSFQFFISPLSKKSILLYLILWSTLSGFSQVTGIIKGQIIDEVSGEPIPFATVQLLETSPPVGAVADLEGFYEIANVPVGRYTVQVSFLGYDPLTLKEVLVTSGKDVVINPKMKESLTVMEEVVVTVRTNKTETVNDLAGIGSRMLSVEEANRYAGGFDDPSRLATSFAGVSGGIQSNGIVIRGNNPQSLLWRMEGVEIYNPNHFADLAAFGGGGLTALSSQMLANSDFMTGAFPAAYGNAISGVFDLSMRTGNVDNRETTLQAGLLGLDFSSEGPLKEQSKSTYLFNYRYSTLTLLEPLLPDNAGGTNYQDLAFKFKLPSKVGLFTFWGLGLIDKSGSDPETDPSKIEYVSDENTEDIRQYNGSSGLKHIVYIGDATFVESDLAVTSSGLDFSIKRPDASDIVQDEERIDNDQFNTIFQTKLNKTIGQKYTVETGLKGNFMNYKLQLGNREEGQFRNTTNTRGSSALLTFYSQANARLGSKWSVLGGLNYQVFLLNNQHLIEPRLSMQWNGGNNSTIGLAYGLHSRVEKIHYYLNEDENGIQNNKNLGLSRAHHLVASYNLNLSENLRIKAEPYYQYLFDVPVIANSSFSFLNLSDNWYLSDPMVNEGKGKNYGLDLTLEKFLSDGVYYMLSGSVYRSEYKGGDGIWRRTAFDRGYLMNVLGGKEWFVGKTGSNILGINLRMNYQGGRRYIPVDINTSIAQMEAIDDNARAYEGQLDPALTVHFSASFRINKPRRSSIWSLSILNLTMVDEFEGFDYNIQTAQIDQIGEPLMIPNLSYKIEF